MRFIDVYTYLGSSKELVCAGDHFWEAAVTSRAPSSLIHNHWSWACPAARTNKSWSDQLGHHGALRASWANKQNFPCLNFTSVFTRLRELLWDGGSELSPWDGICHPAGQNQRCDTSVTVLEEFTSNETLHMQGWEIRSGGFKSSLSCLFFPGVFLPVQLAHCSNPLKHLLWWEIPECSAQWRAFPWEDPQKPVQGVAGSCWCFLIGFALRRGRKIDPELVAATGWIGHY